MKLMRIPAALAAAAASTAVLTAIPASAGIAPPHEMTAEPTSGPVGTTIEVNGYGCYGGFASFALYIITDEAVWPIGVPQEAETDEDGNWSGEIVVGATAIIPQQEGGAIEVPVTPGDNYLIYANCIDIDSETGEPMFEYDTIDFTVTGDTTPTTTPPTTAPPGETPPPAVPVVEEPPFTG